MNDKARPIGALVLIGLGILFLAGQIFDIGGIIGWLWPFFVILPGAAFLYFAYTGGKSQAGLAVPGAVITGTGLILFYQNVTNHWESWAYAWALYPLFVGLALTFMGERTADKGTLKTGQGLVRGGGIAFIVLAALFELVLFGRGGIFGNFAIPLVLIGAGIFMLYRHQHPVFANGFGDKRKYDGYTYSNGKSKNGVNTAVNSRLQREIDEALAEDEEPKV
ncbi:MAG: hypothetical protein R3E39_16790 [Anaerolineae bacterium]